MTGEGRGRMSHIVTEKGFRGFNWLCWASDETVVLSDPDDHW